MIKENEFQITENLYLVEIGGNFKKNPGKQHLPGLIYSVIKDVILPELLDLNVTLSPTERSGKSLHRDISATRYSKVEI